MIDRRLFVAGLAAGAAGRALAAEPAGLSVFELRQYTVKGGTRAAFTRLFEREFVTSQDAVGAHVRAVFRDLDDPDRFVWMRGFADMAAGDFVRWSKQTIDLLDQLSLVAEQPIAGTARKALDAVRRGIVAYSGV